MTVDTAKNLYLKYRRICDHGEPEASGKVWIILCLPRQKNVSYSFKMSSKNIEKLLAVRPLLFTKVKFRREKTCGTLSE